MKRTTTLYFALLLAAVASVWMIVAAGTSLHPTIASAPAIRPASDASHAANPLAILIAQIAVILLLSRALGKACVWIRQPLVIGEMIAGIMLGPSLLGWLLPDVSAWLFPAASIPALRVLSQVGVVLFLFLIGLELDPKLLRNRGHAAVFISHASIAVPFVLGAALTLYLYPRFFRDSAGMDFAAVALFMGAAMSVTAFPVLARMLTERNLHRSEVGAIAITCAAVDDATAWCMLAMVIGIARAEGMMQGLTTAAMAAAYVVAMFVFVRPLLRKLQRLHDQRGGLSQGMLATILMLVLASAWVTEEIGIHALFGAFMMGTMMPKGTQFVRNVFERLEDFTVAFLLPIFFAYAGLQTQIGLLNTGGAWLNTLLIIAVAVAGKFGGTAVAALATGIGRRDSMVLGVLMNTRGLMELVILQIGLQEGVLTPAVFAMMVLMALSTTAMTAPLLSLLIGKQIERAKQLAGGGPAVLIPVAAPESGPAMARLASALLGGGMPANPGAAPPPNSPSTNGERGRVLALHLIRPDDDQFGANLAELDQRRDQALAPILAAAQALRLPLESISFTSTDVAEDVVAVANARDVWLVLMGSHRPLIGTEILGGLVHRVLDEAKCQVGVFIDRGFVAPRRVLVPYLGGPHDRASLALAERMSRLSGSAITVMHVVTNQQAGDGTSPDGSVQGEGLAKVALEKVFVEPISRASVQFKVVFHDSPLDAMLQAAAGYDLVIVGVDEKWGLESHFFGFRPQRLADECVTSTLIVRGALTPSKPNP